MSTSEPKEQGTEELPWLDLKYLTKILNKYTRNQLKEIKKFTKAPATVKGENYVSEMHLITVQYTTLATPEAIEEVSFIAKSMLQNELMSLIEEDFNVFQREAQMYNVIMSEAHQLLRSIGDEVTVFGPEAIYVDERVIIQENLKLKGYSIADVKTGLSFEQCSLILEKLAKFHAVTMVLYNKNPDLFRHHLPGNVSEHPSPLHELYTNSIGTTIEYCRSNPNLQEYVQKLIAFGDKIIPKMINVFSRNQADRFHVLNHGDVWVNNLMFRQLEDVLFVDYQEGFFGSPGIDWNYFIFSSWQTEVFEHHYDDLIEIYHKNLADVLNKLKHEQRIPTIEDVKKEILNKGYHGLSTATCILPILINEHEELTDVINFLTETDEAAANRRKVFDNPKYGERLEVFLRFFAAKGIL